MLYLRLLRNLQTALSDYSKEYPKRLWFTSLMTLMMVTTFCALTYKIQISDASVDEALTTEEENIPVIPTALPEPTLEPTPVIEPIDIAFTAAVELTNCEDDDGCEVPLWETYERETLTGTIPEGAIVDILSCYYPVVRADLQEDQSIITEFSSYTIEGLWCEAYYLSISGEPVKGMIQYWYLNLDLVEE